MGPTLPVHHWRTLIVVDERVSAKMSDPPSGTPQTIKSVEKLFRIVDALVELDGARVTELASHLDLPKSSVHNYLQTMVGYGYAVQEGDQYHAGLRFLTVGGHLREREEAYKLSRPIVKNLADETDERAQFIVEENGRGIFVHRTTGARAVDAGTRIGKRIWLHATGAGKVLLAYSSLNRRDEIIERWGLPERTENTITDRDELESELEVIRENGYAINDEEGTIGLRSVAVPVFGPDEELVGALGVSGPSQRLTNKRCESEFVEELFGSANELELRLTYG